MDGGERHVRNCRHQRCNRGRNQGIYPETGESGMAALIIHDKFGMLMKKEVEGKSRKERFIDEWEKQYKLFEAGRMTLEDIQEVLRDECGITMKREDAQHREWM